MIKMKIGYVPINGNPCQLCCLSNVCPQEGFCKCDQYWKENPEDHHAEDSEVYFLEIKEE